ncbi:aspartyl protease family protein [Klebsormidium nitens]|uniref:Aspartyl protease family protein n=1 Tax=Klebsormidium nitens TaxID=105231 RepID=A0A1Y1I0Y5_KLENI|nr:aspartyl protease family protein [Klebsormidium nitens]|eukprot:GAQ83622.1 aspartyl protease family protein [Klebsormidium nitens]
MPPVVVQKPLDGAPRDQTQPQTSWSGLLTHRDAEYLPEKGGESPYFKRHMSGALQGQRVYWEKLVRQALGGNKRRSLLAVQNLPINGTLETGNYFVTMQLGTPPQNVTLLLDTGSSLFWVECNTCADCTGLTERTAFQPQLSLSIVTPGCGNCPDYEYGLCASSPNVADPSELDACFSLCAANQKQCYYGYSYGDGSQTGGYIQKDILTVPSSNSSAVFSNITFGCNYLAADPNNPDTTQLIVGPQISGLVGLGKSNYSVQNQLASAGVISSTFSVCMAGVEGGGVFTLGNSSRVVPGMQYIPMGTHPEFYNVTLAAISVGTTPLPIAPSVFFLQPPISRFRRANPFFLPDAIFDTGTSFTILADAAYQALVQGFLRSAPVGYAPVYIDQYGYIVSISGGPTGNAAPAPTAVISEPGVPRTNSTSAPNQLCFNIPVREIGPLGQIDVSGFPNVTFSFVNSEALLTVDPNDYMYIFQSSDLTGLNQAILACPTFISDGGGGTTILGEYTMRNHFFVFDTAARRIGVAPVTCSNYT